MQRDRQGLRKLTSSSMVRDQDRGAIIVPRPAKDLGWWEEKTAGTSSHLLARAHCQHFLPATWDFLWVTWNHPWWEYLHRGNWQVLNFRSSYPQSLLLTFTSTVLGGRVHQDWEKEWTSWIGHSLPTVAQQGRKGINKLTLIFSYPLPLQVPPCKHSQKGQLSGESERVESIRSRWKYPAQRPLTVWEDRLSHPHPKSRFSKIP